MKKILSPGNTNAKTKKNYRPTKILYLHPSKIEGKEMCPFASEGCRMSCLNTAGRGAFTNVQEARIERTKHYVLDKDKFMDKIYKEIVSFAKYYERKGMDVAIRLNGTSDQPLVESLVKSYEIPKNVLFYDYTKNPKKAGRRVFSDGTTYTVTFSRSEKDGSDDESLMVLNNGGMVAVVFDKLPKTWNGYLVVDGDKRDDLMLDIDEPCVIGLLAKGKAKKDASGFVVKYTTEHKTYTYEPRNIKECAEMV
jgi:hypothetical protein